MKFAITSVVLLSVIVQARAAVAQSSAPVYAGQRVKLATPHMRSPAIGRVVGVTPGLVNLAVGRGTEATIPLHQITSLWTSEGINRSTGALRGALAGLGLGAIWFASLKPEVGQDPFGVGTLAVGVVTLGLVPGIGTLIGTAIAPERWSPVAVPASRATVSDSGASLRLSPLDEVRARTARGTLRGRPDGESGPSLVLMRRGRSETVPWREVSELSVLADRDRRRGAVRGVVVITAITTIGVATDPLPSFGENLSVYLGNAAFGALVGAFFPMKRWVGLPLPGR